MLTGAQALLLKAEINADGALSGQPDDGTGNQFIADALNALAAPDFMVWKTDASVQDIYDAISWAAYTPTGAVDNATVTSQLIAAQRQTQLLAIQTKQLNLQNLTIGRQTVDASKPNIRAGLRDAVIQVPAGNDGANVNPGGTSGNIVLNTMTRKATRAEKVLVAALNQQTGGVTASILGFEGLVTVADVSQARNAV